MNGGSSDVRSRNDLRLDGKFSSEFREKSRSFSQRFGLVDIVFFLFFKVCVFAGDKHVWMFYCLIS